MTSQFIIQLTVLAMLGVLVIGVAFKVGRKFGHADRLPQLEMLWRYQHAVDDLDRWCGHTSPHARLIARHITAICDGVESINSGTPRDVEPCTIDGLRAQLKKLDAIESTIGEHAIGGDRLRAAMRAYDTGRTMQAEAKKAISDFVGDPANYRDAPSIHPISRA